MDMYPTKSLDNEFNEFWKEFIDGLRQSYNKDDYDPKLHGHEPVPGVTKGMPSWNKGIPLSEEHKKNLSESQKGRTQPESQRKAASIAAKKTTSVLYTCSKCGKQNIIGNHKRWHEDKCGIKYTHSEETKKNISKGLTGRKLSESHVKKIAEKNRLRRGRKYTKQKSLDVLF